MSESAQEVTMPLQGALNTPEVPETPQVNEPSEVSVAQDKDTPVGHETRNVRPEIPEGMSKSQWKKQQRKVRFQERKAEFAQIRKEKKQAAKAARREKIQEYVAKGEPIPEELLNKRPKIPENQTKTGTTLIIDCDFDDLMTEKERNSLSSQITRSYSSNRHALYTVDLKITSFNKLLKKRFEEDLKASNHSQWPNVVFQEEPFSISDEDKGKYIYLSADSDETIDELVPGVNYIIGGIVDKGRYKNLCKDKAEKMGIKTKRLPIDEYIKLSGRKVLTTTHVVELILKWHELKNWKRAFESVLPQRKLVDVNGRTDEAEADVDDE